jgi:hypothetical protein
VAVDPAALALSCFSREELEQITLPQRVSLSNMLAERLRRAPAPTPQEIQGIRQLATRLDVLPGS